MSLVTLSTTDGVDAVNPDYVVSVSTDHRLSVVVTLVGGRRIHALPNYGEPLYAAFDRIRTALDGAEKDRHHG